MSGHPRDEAREQIVSRLRNTAEKEPLGSHLRSTMRKTIAFIAEQERHVNASLAREEAERAGRERAEAALERARDYCARPPGVCFPAREPGKEHFEDPGVDPRDPDPDGIGEPS